MDDGATVGPEPFGGLLYHFGTWRLSFLKDATLLAVRGEHPHRRLSLQRGGHR